MPFDCHPQIQVLCFAYNIIELIPNSDCDKNSFRRGDAERK